MPIGIPLGDRAKFSTSAWWSTGRADDLRSAFENIAERDGARGEDYRNFCRIYANRNIAGLGPRAYVQLRTNERVTLNVSKAACDAIVAKLTRNKIRPRFLTSGGNPSLRRKARLLERWVDMQLYVSRIHEEVRRAIVDMAVVGTGCLHVMREGDCPRAERVFAGDLFVDPVEGVDGRPRTLYRRHLISKERLRALFPKKKAAIEGAGPPKDSFGPDFARDSLSDQCEVIEAWHLPSKEDADDGRHMIVLRAADGEDDSLSDEPWERQTFPIVFMRWSEPLRGFWGVGLVEELLGLQLEVNKTLQKIQKAFHLLAVPQVWVEAGSRVKKSQVTNEIASINQYTGQPPIFLTPQTVHPEVFRHLDWMYMRAYEIAGVGASSAGLPPPGLESGVAIREWSASGDDRFSPLLQAVEEAYLALADRLVDLGREIAKANPGYTVVAARDRHTIANVPWKEVDLAKDAYVLKVFPASALPTSPAGRLAAVVDLVNAQLITPPTAQRLLDFPDLEEEMALDRAAADNIGRLVEKCLDEGEIEMPEPFMDLQLALKRAQAAYNKALVDGGVPEENMAALRRWMVAVAALMEKARQEAMRAAGPPTPGSPPPVNGMGQQPMAVTPSDGRVAQPPQ